MAMMVASAEELVVLAVLLDMTVDLVDSEDHEVELVVLLEVLAGHPDGLVDRPVMMGCSLIRVQVPVVTRSETAHQT